MHSIYVCETWLLLQANGATIITEGSRVRIPAAPRLYVLDIFLGIFSPQRKDNAHKTPLPMIMICFKPQIGGLLTATVSAVCTGVWGALLAAASAPRSFAGSSGLTAPLRALSHRHAQRLQGRCGRSL